MKKRIFSIMTAFALVAGAMTSCQKDWTEDINKLQSDVSALSTQVSALDAQIKAGAVITNVAQGANGVTVTLSNGQTFNVTNGAKGDKGDKGDTGAQGIQGVQGIQGIQGVQGEKGDKGDQGDKGENGLPGTPGSVITIEDGEWYIDGKETGMKVISAEDLTKVKVPYINEDGVFVFFDEEGEEIVTEIKAKKTVYAIEANGEYTLIVPDENGEMVELKFPGAGSTVSSVDFMGIAYLNDGYAVNPNPGGYDQLLAFNYAYITKITKAYDGNIETTWSAQKNITKKQVLANFGTRVLMARINAGADIEDLSFSLKNSKGETLPIVLTPSKFTGYLTRSTNDIYTFAMDLSRATYNSVNDFNAKFPAAQYSYNYTTSSGGTYTYTGDILYALTEKGGFVSNYVVYVQPNDISNNVPAGNAVLRVNDKLATWDSNDGKKVYEVALNEDNKITRFSNSYAVDYYVEAVDPTIASMFGFTADKTNGTFKVTKLADKITTTSFEAYVYILNMDGQIWRDKINIKPVRSLGVNTAYDLGNVTIKSSMDLTVDLAKMFGDLGAEDSAIWKNATLGAQNMTVEVVDEDGKDVSADLGINVVTDNVNNQFVAVNQTSKLVIKPVTNTGATPNVATMKPGTEYTYTIKFTGKANNVLNKITVKFTPVMPALSSFVEKREALWVGNTLMAYFVDPTFAQSTSASTVIASTYDMTKGFTNLGATGNNDVTITFKLDTDQMISDKKVVATNMASIINNVITLKETTIGTTKKHHAYAQPLNVKVEAKYLGGAYSFDKEEQDALAFTIKVQSALEAGKIVPTEGTSIKLPAAAAGETAKLTSAMITGYTYNNQPYSIFPDATVSTIAGFKYSYVQKVEFESADNEIYTVDNATIKPSSFVNGVGFVPGYVEISSQNISQTTVTSIKVKVTDWFGYTKTAEIPLTITVGE